MPNPKRINSRAIWDKLQLDLFFDALPQLEVESEDNPWNRLPDVTNNEAVPQSQSDKP
jgi:hypothetical protein